MNKPPMGIMPRKLVDEDRADKIAGAVKRYMAASKQIPIAWIEELNEIMAREIARTIREAKAGRRLQDDILGTTFVKDCEICGKEHEMGEKCPFEASIGEIPYFRDHPITWWLKLRDIARNMMDESKQPSGAVAIAELSDHLEKKAFQEYL